MQQQGLDGTVSTLGTFFRRRGTPLASGLVELGYHGQDYITGTKLVCLGGDKRVGETQERDQQQDQRIHFTCRSVVWKEREDRKNESSHSSPIGMLAALFPA